jgi:hypothetical protein
MSDVFCQGFLPGGDYSCLTIPFKVQNCEAETSAGREAVKGHFEKIRSGSLNCDGTAVTQGWVFDTWVGSGLGLPGFQLDMTALSGFYSFVCNEFVIAAEEEGGAVALYMFSDDVSLEQMDVEAARTLASAGLG